MTLRLEPLATPFDPADDPITIATPSCCCCCCCCLVTLTTATTVAGAEAYYLAKENDRSRWAPTVVGLAAVPAGLAAAYVARVDDLTTVLVTCVGVFVALMALALKLGGAGTKTAVGVPIVTAVTGATFFVVEIAAALGTLFMIEFLAPAGIWGGIAIARGRHERRTGNMPIQQMDVSHLAPPPPSWGPLQPPPAVPFAPLPPPLPAWEPPTPPASEPPPPPPGDAP